MGTLLPKTNIKCPVVVAKSHIALVPGRARFTGLNLDRSDECRIMQHWFSFPLARPSLDLRQPCPSRPFTLILADISSVVGQSRKASILAGGPHSVSLLTEGFFAASCCHLIERETLKIKSIHVMSLNVFLSRSFLSVWPWSYLKKKCVTVSMHLRLRSMIATASNESISHSESRHDHDKSMHNSVQSMARAF